MATSPIPGTQHGTDPDYWPNAGTECADGPGGKGNPFPTYYTTNFYGVDQLRVSTISMQTRLIANLS